MIDTIAINLKESEFIMQPSFYNRFSPSIENFFTPPFQKLGAKGMIKADCNPLKAERDSGICYPRLTMFRAVRAMGIRNFLRIEVSIPKLLYGNNFDEVDQADFELICKIMVERLKNFGVLVTEKRIAEADVTAIHYSKNIALTNYSTPSQIIREMNKADINLLKDTSSSNYRNSGHAFKIHTNNFEFIAYDKKEDLKKAKISEKRAIEKFNECQISLFEDNNFKKPFEVLRIEARYGNKKELKKLFEQLNLNPVPEFRFSSLFSKELSQLALKQEVAKIKVCHPSAMDYKFRTPKTLFSDLVVKNPDKSLSTILSAVGLRALLDEIGSTEIKSIGGRKPSEWYKFKQKMQKMVYTPRTTGCFELIEQGLEVFRPLKLGGFKLDEKNL